MQTDWFRTVELHIDAEAFKRLPRHAAYRYEYRKGVATISGRPRYLHAEYDLQRSIESRAHESSLSDRYELRSWAESSLQSPQQTQLESISGELGDSAAVIPAFQNEKTLICRHTPLRQGLVNLFVSAFGSSAPLRYLNDSDQLHAASDLMGGAIRGAFGPTVADASFTLWDRSDDSLIGCVQVTQVPNGNWTDFNDPIWQQAPPEDGVDPSWGQPHLTWIFTDPRHQRSGLGAALFQKACSQLAATGHQRLFSTMLLGNDASLLWHWKMGFQLLSDPNKFYRPQNPRE